MYVQIKIRDALQAPWLEVCGISTSEGGENMAWSPAILREIVRNRFLYPWVHTLGPLNPAHSHQQANTNFQEKRAAKRTRLSEMNSVLECTISWHPVTFQRLGDNLRKQLKKWIYVLKKKKQKTQTQNNSLTNSP